MPLFDDEQHTLLGFGQEDFISRHPLFPQGNLGQVEFDAGSGVARHFKG